MATLLPYAYGFVAGAALMGAWWWWINHRAKARATVQEIQQMVKKV